MTMARLKSLLAAWASEKALHDLVLSDESLIDHFFRYLEETYGCGHLAAHVAHGCIMALDEHVVRSHTLLPEALLADACHVLMPVFEWKHQRLATGWWIYVGHITAVAWHM